VIFIGFWRHKRLDKSNIAFDSLTDNFLSDNGVEENVKLDDDFFQVVRFVSFFFSDKESVVFFQNVLDLADNMRPPDDLPVFF
jgi:hypothetical protein